MAGTQGAAVSIRVLCNQFASCRTKSLLPVSASISASFSSKLTNRKNHLRIKILKTLTKPYPFNSTPILPRHPLTDLAIQIVSPEISQPNDVETELSSPAECYPTTTTNGNEVEVSRFSKSSNTATPFSFGVGNFSLGSVLRFGVYFLAVFAFQTICAVWVLDYGNSIKDDKNSDSVFGASRREVLLNGNEKILHGNFGTKTSQLVYLEESKMREKIQEIRSMAREARKKEKNKLSEDFGDEGTEDGNVTSRARIGIEKEVDARLVTLQKRLNSAREKIPESHVNYLLRSEKVEDAVERNDLNGEEGNKTLTFKKKFKYRNSSNERMKKPKGFQGFVSNVRKSGSTGNGKVAEDGNFVGDTVKVKDSEKQVGKEIMRSVSEMFKDDGMNLASIESVLQPQSDRKKLDIGATGVNTKPSNGVIQETSSVGILKSRNSRDLEVKNSQSFTKVNQESLSTSAMLPVMSSNNSFVGKKHMPHEGRGKQSNKENDLWWSNLPYVLVIFMHRGSDDEEQGGLFTLKIPSKAQDLEDSTYTVAFEAQVDANNFCYLLESFFEDLDDFTADVVPLATKELEKVVKSYTSNIIVVKKGQLELYAGQPFTDVEMALHDLVEQNENVISLDPR